MSIAEVKKPTPADLSFQAIEGQVTKATIYRVPNRNGPTVCIHVNDVGPYNSLFPVVGKLISDNMVGLQIISEGPSQNK